MSNWIRIQDEYAAQNGVFYSYDADAIPLGKGGMGTVFLGYCVKDDGSGNSIFVAIKRVEGNFDELLSRARQEASVQIEHENLLRMYAYIDNVEPDEQTGQGTIRHYVIMDLLNGVDLDNLIAGKLQNGDGEVIPLAKSLYDQYNTDRGLFIRNVMTKVLAGIGTLHKYGIVHRDLDPSNIMITTSEEGDRIKVIDYGVSKHFGDGAVAVVNHKTTIGSFIGKSSYAAPEVVVGDVENHNQTTDIYALGIMMYQLYVGDLPFVGNDADVRRMQLDTEVPVDKIDDKQIRKIVKKATEKEQNKRYQSAEEMLHDLELNVTTEPEPVHVETMSAEDWHPEEKAPTARIPVKLAAVILTIVPIVGFTIGYLIHSII